MSALAMGRPGPAPARRPLGIGAAAAAVLVAFGIAAPSAALHGWLIGFAFAGAAPLGALALLLIHALTGGRWGEAHRPALLALALATPALVLMVLPLVLAAPLLYPWAADPAAAGPGVAARYLNVPAVGLRDVLGLGILSAVAWRLARGRLGALGAGLGLCAYAVFMNAAAYDWLLSLAPRFTSSAFGAQVIVAQILSGLCGAVLLSDADAHDPSWADLGGLLLAVTLGESYLLLISAVIDWYGDLPAQAAWYLERLRHGWRWIATAGTLVGAVLPVLALLLARVRRTPALLRPVALAVLAGLWIEDVWLVAPGTAPASVVTGVVGAVAAASLLTAASRRLGRARHVD